MRTSPRSTRKLDHYIAVHVAGERNPEAAVFDMLRYDTCYPVTPTAAPRGWMIFKQDHRPGYAGGFTLDRWRSFGFRELHVATAPVGHAYPSELLYLLQDIEAKREDARKAKWLPGSFVPDPRD